MIRNLFVGMTTGFMELRRAAGLARGSLRTADGRWALVSTSLTASVAGVIAVLALSATPPSSARAFEPRRQQAALPYELLARLSGVAPLPTIAAEDAGRMALGANHAGDMAPGDTEDETLDSALAAEDLGVSTPGVPGVETRTLTMSNGDTIVGMLNEAGVAADDIVAVVNALRPVYSLRNLRAGQAFQASFAPSTPTRQSPAVQGSGDTPAPKLLALSFLPVVDHEITVTLSADGTYLAQDVQKKLESRYQHAGATIDSSLYLAAMQAGIPASMVVEMIRMFSYEVDFQRDVHPGDSFEVFYNGYYTQEGQPAKDGNILVAAMILGGKKHTLYRYETANGDVEYFNATGQSAKSMLMKTPVDGARISSGFGMRVHPVLGYTRMHKGIDFAVPDGTPVMAAGNGTIMFAGVESGYGNFVLIGHGNGYATAYGHLSRFASGIRKGMHVHQGQVIAYSGHTGLSTGPHLHYEIRVNSVQVNPLRVRVAMGRQLQGQELRTFLADRSQTDQLEASMPLQRTVAQSGDLRDSRDQ